MSRPVFALQAFVKQRRRVGEDVEPRLEVFLDAIANAAPQPGDVPLTGHPGRWRHRIGDWRVIYEVRRDCIEMQAVLTRGEVFSKKGLRVRRVDVGQRE